VRSVEVRERLLADLEQKFKVVGIWVSDVAQANLPFGEALALLAFIDERQLPQAPGPSFATFACRPRAPATE
jgi:hypothetical protein